MPKDFMTIDPKAAGSLARKSSAALVASITTKTAMNARLIAPGSMKQHIRPIITGGGSPMGIVVCDHTAAMYVLRGTKPHEIRPRKAKMLKFDVKGTTVYAKIVRHPGTKENNFLWKALLAAKRI